MGEKGVSGLLFGNAGNPPISETDAYRQDVQEFPDEATLYDYARVRGMGWKEGAPVTSSSSGTTR
jgi:hypothetical protein